MDQDSIPVEIIIDFDNCNFGVLYTSNPNLGINSYPIHYHYQETTKLGSNEELYIYVDYEDSNSTVYCNFIVTNNKVTRSNLISRARHIEDHYDYRITFSYP